MPLPRFRPLVKVMPFRHEEKDVFLVTDHQEALFDHQVVLPPIAFVVAAFLDGRREVADVQKEVADKIQGLQLAAEEIEGVVRDLDQHFLLESGRLQERRREIERDFLGRATRPARFVRGTREELAGELGKYFTDPAGAGAPGARNPDSLAGILAPHIDFPRGGNCYTFAYREVAETSDAEVYVILGVAHLSPPNPFVVTAKDYETPLGAAATDRGVVEALRRRLGDGIFENEAVHRSEHSAEFQAVFLRHARPDASFTIVPILCSSFEPHCGDASPSTVPRIQEFLAALQESLEGRKACLVAGVDFAHVGPVFGDEVEIDDRLIQWMVAADNKSLLSCADGDAEAFWNSIMADGNARHVCGLSATYAFLRLLGGTAGKILKYGFAPDPAGGIVSFASMSFRSAPRLVLP